MFNKFKNKKKTFNNLQDDDFKQLGNDSVQQAYVLLESTEWKDEKITSQNDKIQSGVKNVGKVYKLTVS